MPDLLRDVTVAADEYVWEAAGGLTLGELVSLLGRRADGLPSSGTSGAPSGRCSCRAD